MKALRSLLSHPLLVALAMVLLFKVGALACGAVPGNDDDDDSAASALCSGASCTNGSRCPAAEPSDGASCESEQYGNCHYCPAGSSTARGYTCDGSTWSYVDSFECE